MNTNPYLNTQEQLYQAFANRLPSPKQQGATPKKFSHTPSPVSKEFVASQSFDNTFDSEVAEAQRKAYDERILAQQNPEDDFIAAPVTKTDIEALVQATLTKERAAVAAKAKPVSLPKNMTKSFGTIEFDFSDLTPGAN